MNAKIITYDLCQPGRDYRGLINRIQQYPNACRVCESSWLVATTWNSQQIRDDLVRYIDKNDRLFVAELTGETAWHNTLSTYETIKKALT